MVGVTTNTTLITMGENCRVEDLTLSLTSTGHYTLVGVLFGGTSSVTAKLRTCVVNVNNSTASTAGTSNVYGVLSNGTGTLGASTFSFNCIKGSTINVYSNGGGNKRGIVINTSNILTTRDLNVYVAAPTDPTSAGSYVGVETADPANTGSVQLRSTTVGTTPPSYVASPGAIQLYTASDILQTNPTVVLNPTYLASPGIQIGPGVDLVSKTAGGLPFSNYTYPTTVYWGLKGTVSTGTSGFMWPGTVPVTAGGVFPDASGIIGTFTVIATAYTSGGGNSGEITVSAITGIAVNMPVVFENSWGPFTGGTTYFVNQVSDATHIFVSATYNGLAITTATPAVGTASLLFYSTISITATAVNASNQVVSVTPAGFSLQVGYPIVFTNTLGYVNSGVVYYVASLASPTTFTISATLNGPTFVTGVQTLTTSSGLTSGVSSTILVVVASWATSGNITVTGTGRPCGFMVTGMPVVFNTSFGGAGGIVAGTKYYVLTIGGAPGYTAFQVTTTYSGSTAVTFSAAGTGSYNAVVWPLFSPPAYYRIQQPFILCGMMTSLNLPANITGATATSTNMSLFVCRTPVNSDLQQGVVIIPAYTQTYNDATTIVQTYFNSTQTFNVGDRVHVFLTYAGGAAMTAQDVTVQLDFF